jgi:hypothetical protein
MATTESPRPSATIEFETTELEREIADLLPLYQSSSRFPAFNALRHLNRAWRIRLLDPEMTVFRCITAEEEAATAVFKALQRHGYHRAEKLNSHNHVHKNALIPFVAAVSRILAGVRENAPETQLLFDKNLSPPELHLQIKVPHPITGEALWATPVPPLHFSMSRTASPLEKGVRVDFSAGMQEVASEANAKSVTAHLRDRANKRNRILYAAETGYPGVAGDIEAGFKQYKRNVYTLLKLYVMIDPYPKHQDFVQQCLAGFLKTLKLLPEDVAFE